MNVTIACPCPGTPHASDSVTLRDRLDFAAARAIRYDVRVLKTRDDEATWGEVLATLTLGYIVHGVERWTLVDGKGRALPVTRDNIRAVLLTNDDAATVVGDAADELYTEPVMLPLLREASSSSPATPTNDSTSQRTDGSPRRPKRSSRSSTTTTPTGATVTTSPSRAGASSSSPSSASAD